MAASRKPRTAILRVSWRVALPVLLALVSASPTFATSAPRPGGTIPDALKDRLTSTTRPLRFTHSLLALSKRAQANAVGVAWGSMSLLDADLQGGTTVGGKRSIPVFPVLSSDSGPAPYDPGDL